MPQIGTLNSITVPPQRGELLLDRYPIDAAFSLRRVRSDYDGPCVRVYAANASGSKTYADIGFTPEGDLDIEELKRHCSNVNLRDGVDGFVHTWYNQSAEGGKYNAVQTNTSLMPKIFDATDGYLGSLKNEGNDYLELENNVAATSDIYAVYEPSSTNLYGPVVGESGSNPKGLIVGDSTTVGVTNNRYNGTGTYCGDTDDTKFLACSYTATTGTSPFITINGYVAGQAESPSNQTNSIGAIFTTINSGTPATGASDFDGKIYEVFLSTSDLSADRIEIENDILYNNNLPVPGTSFVRENPGAKLAISTRSLNREYVGPIMRVRAARANQLESGIFLDENGVVNERRITRNCTDTGSVLVDGFVITWYDQSGEENDAVNATDASQPKIHDATDGIIFSNGNIGVEFADTLGQLDTGYTPASGDFSFYVVGNVTPVASGDDDINNIIGTVQHAGASDVGRWYLSNSSGNEQFTFGSYGQDTLNLTTAVGSVPSSEMFLGSVSVDSDGNSSVYSSGSLVASSTGATTSHSSSLVVGRTNNSRGFSGVLSEISFYEDDTASQRETIEENINKHFLIYQEVDTTSGFVSNSAYNVKLAHSVRKLSDSLLCCKIERSSDNATKNIGWGSDGFIDTQAIIDFCGSSSGKVLTVYDQSGQGYHAYADTSLSNFLWIYDGTDIYTSNGRPAFYQKDASTAATYRYSSSGAYSTLNEDAYSYTSQTKASYSVVAGPMTQNSDSTANGQDYLITTGDMIIYRDFNQRLRVDIFDSGEAIITSISTADAASNQRVIMAGGTLGGTVWGHIDDFEDNDNVDNPEGWYGDVSTHVINIFFSVNTEQADNPYLQETIFYDNDFRVEGTLESLKTEINDAFDVFASDETPTSGFLSEFSGAAAAYSVRKLGDSPVCMRVRKTVSSVDYYQVIGFDSNGDLDIAAIEEFGGSADVFVQTWYDQSGNGRHQVQDTNAEQPKIYDGTDGIVYENGKPAVEFDTGFMTDSSANEIDILGHSTHFVANRGTTLNREALYGAAIDATPYNTFVCAFWDDLGTYDFQIFTNSSSSHSFDLNRQTVDQGIISILMPDSASDLISCQLNNNDIVEHNVDPINISSDSDFVLRLGSQGYNEYRGNIQEFIVYSDGKSGTDRTNIQENQNEYFLVHQSASASPATGLLSKAPNAHTAISTRQLGDALLCLRARRVSDDVERNIGFVGGKLDEATLEEFSQGGDVRIVKWYDQSGNDRHYYSPRERTYTVDGVDYQFGDIAAVSTLQMPLLYEAEFGPSKFKGFPCVDQHNTYSGSSLYSSNCGDEKATMAFWVGKGRANDDSYVFYTDVHTYVDSQESEYFFRPRIGYADLAINGSITGDAWNYKERSDEYTAAVNRYNDSFPLVQISLDVNSSPADSSDSLEPLLGGRFSAFSEDPPQSGVTINPVRTKHIEFITYSSGDFDEMRAIVDTDQNNYYRIYDTFKSGLLDSFPGAVAAYSLRRLSSSYDGPLIRVSRNGSEVDVYPNGQGELNIGEVLSLSPTNVDETIEVVTWYDQSGNGNDLTAAANLAPKIKTGELSSTSNLRNICYLNDRPALDFNTVANGMFTANNRQWLSGTTGRTIIAVGQADSTATNSTIASIAYDVSPEVGEAMYLTAEAAVRVNGNATYDKDFGGAPKILFYALPESSNVGDGTIHVNGVAATATPSGTVAIDTANYPGGYSGVGNVQLSASSTAYDGKMQEVIVYDSDQSENREGIERDINRYYETYTKPLLDVVPDAAAAYSLRKLRSDYTGPAINVYNGTDYKDIYFRTNGELDTKEIQRFCGSNNGTVAIWYDQSGNNNHAEQTDTSLMPKVYDGTTGFSTPDSNERIAVIGDTTSYFRTSPITDEFANGYTYFGVVDSVGYNRYPFMYGVEVQATSFGMRGATPDPFGFAKHRNANINSTDPDAIRNDNQGIIQGVFHDGSGTLDIYVKYEDGSDFDYSTSILPVDSTTGGHNLTLMASWQSDAVRYPINGYIQELILWDSDNSDYRGAIEGNINHYYSIY